MSSRTKEVEYISVRYLRVDPLTKRNYYDEETKRRLRDSIKEDGFKEEHALVVRPDPERKGHWLITCGQNRFEAGVRAGTVQFPCVKRRKQDDLMALREAYDDNVLRCDPDPITQAECFYKVGKEKLKGYGKKDVDPLTQKYQMPIASIALELNEPEPFVKRRLTLLKLPQAVQKMVSRCYMKNQKGFKLSPAIGEELAKGLWLLRKQGVKNPEWEINKLAFRFFKNKTTQREARKTLVEIGYLGYENWENSTGQNQKETRCAICGAVTDHSWVSLCDTHMFELTDRHKPDYERPSPLPSLKPNPNAQPLHEVDPELHKLRTNDSEVRKPKE
jgi:hypothetical protein